MAKEFFGVRATAALTKLIKGALADKQDKLTGKAGQVVGFDSEGHPVAQEPKAEVELPKNLLSYTDAGLDVPLPVDADTLEGHKASDFVTTESIDDVKKELEEYVDGKEVTLPEHLITATDVAASPEVTLPINADNLGGHGVEYFASVKHVQEAVGDASAAASGALSSHNDDPDSHENLVDKILKKFTDSLATHNEATDSHADIRARFSNPNLLHNWYFQDPINQRGQSEYKQTSYDTTYFIDRWACTYPTTITLDKIGLKFSGTSYIQQRIEENLLGKTVTFSVLTGDNVLHSVTATIPLTQLSSEVSLVAQSSSGVAQIFLAKADRAYTTFYQIFVPEASTIVAAKLELGDKQTLAHQDADGKWVLNDPPPNKAVELLKCQRYYLLEFPVLARCSNPTAKIFISGTAWPVRMRANPTFNLSGLEAAPYGASPTIRINLEPTFTSVSDILVRHIQSQDLDTSLTYVVWMRNVSADL